MSGCRSRQDLTFQYPCSLRFPLQAGGTEPTRPTRFPSRSGGNLKEGGKSRTLNAQLVLRLTHSTARVEARARRG